MRWMPLTFGALSLLAAAPAFAQSNVDDAMEALGLQTGNSLNVGGNTYVVVPGDTLWEICQQFFGDPEYWPTLWSINNDEITNPHYIYPGQLLQFQPGTDTRPPSIVVNTDPAPFDDLSLDDNFVPLVNVFETNRDCKVNVPFNRTRGSDVTLNAPNFVSRTPVEPLGVLEKAVPGKTMLGRGDTVYMRFRNNSDVNCGDVYTMYHHNKEIRHPEVRSARLGHDYQVTGEVLITDVGERWVTGRLVNAFGEIERGELITDRVPVVGKVRTLTLAQDLDGFVIDKSNQENLLMQRNQVVFLDRGRNDGVQSGTTFWVVRRGDGLTTKERRVDQTLPDQVIGIVTVFSADEHISTAVVTDQAIDVKVGDRIVSRLD
jgi:hypothetical protein